ncbi:hypothetical protein CJF31_00008496 [Rutstroemia sp. NJR-2017a BVV2]|nr:hypothetical protein CJF31_00008496 [Rutstroemia sp. NJR-2017a BVV2]
MLISPLRNPVRKQPLDTQIEFYKLLIKVYQLSRKLREYTKNIARYIEVYIEKEISEKNLADRTIYSDTYLYDPVFEFWDYYLFTDEVYIDPIARAQDRVL